MKLYELPGKYAEIYEQAIESGGEIGPGTDEKLDNLLDLTDEMIENEVKLIENWEAIEQSAREESQRLAQVASKMKGSIARRKAYIVHSLRQAGLDKAGKAPFGVRVQKNSAPSVTYTGNVEDLPLYFVTHKPEFDKTAAFMWNELGRVLPDGVKVETGFHLRIV